MKDEKRCLLCGVTKPINQFNRRATRYCTACVRRNEEHKKARETEAILKGQASNLEMFRICPRCNQSRANVDFMTPGPKARCRDCRNEEYKIKREQDNEEREKYLASLETEGISTQSWYTAVKDIKKECNTCGESKPITAFRIANGEHGDFYRRDNKCKDCVRLATNNAAALRRERARQDRIEASLALSWEERREQKRRKDLNSHYKGAYGKTIEEYDEMVRQQNGCCAICGRRPSAIGETLVVDHSHVTGTVRGLLCFWCNIGLGWFQDNMTSLSQAAEYLKSYQTWEDQEYIEDTLSRSSVSLTEAS